MTPLFDFDWFSIFNWFAFLLIFLWVIFSKTIHVIMKSLIVQITRLRVQSAQQTRFHPLTKENYKYQHPCLPAMKWGTDWQPFLGALQPCEENCPGSSHEKTCLTPDVTLPGMAYPSLRGHCPRWTLRMPCPWSRSRWSNSAGMAWIFFLVSLLS